MKKLSDEEHEWLHSPYSVFLRKHFDGQRELALQALIGAAAASTDPQVRHHAASYLAWKAAVKEMTTTHESDN